jgi:hypothetical protein
MAIGLLATMTAALAVGATGCGGGQAAHAVHASAVPVTKRSVAALPPSPHGLKSDEDDEDVRIDLGVRPPADNDADGDNDKTENRGKGYYDTDDVSMATFGRAAGSRDARALREMAARYIGAERAADGRAACAMLVPAVASSLVETYGSSRSGFLRGSKSCQAVMSRLFGHIRRRFSTPTKIVAVRVAGDRAVVLIGSKLMPASYFSLRRERGGWRLTEIQAATLS